MGNCDCNVKDINWNEGDDSNKLKISDFALLYPIGRGGFGRVWKVRLKRQYSPNTLDERLLKNKSRIFAMKEMSKAKVCLKKSIESVANERNFLEKFNYNLLCNMYYAFQDEETLYIVMDYLSGGDLRFHICRRAFFTEEETKFIAACITLSLNYIHEKNVVHRDLKPENLVFGEDGYLRLTDFGIAMEYHKGSDVVSASGTPGYMAPEAMLNKPHDFSVDYFALGVIIYELMIGERPYQGKNRKEIKEQMFTLEIQLDKDDLPEDWNDENILDIINKLLRRKRGKRLGSKGCFEIRNHPWFKDIQWEKIENCTLASPFVFDSEDNFDDSYAQKQDNDSIYEGQKDFYILEVNKSNQFNNFYFNIEDKYIAKENNDNNENNNDNNDNNDNIESVDLKDIQKGNKTYSTSKSSVKKIDNESIIVHNMRGNNRIKSVKFQNPPLDKGNRIIKLLKKDSRNDIIIKESEDK
jgi:serine/threonine protein kinase